MLAFKVRTFWLMILLITSLLLAACDQSGGEEEVAVDPTPTEESDGEESAPVSGEATVDNVELLMMESFPVQINAIIKGNLADGCTSIDEITQERSGNNYTIQVTTLRPGDAVCTTALVPFEEIISLDVVDLPAGTYLVDVNGVKQTFLLSADNSAQAEPTPEPTDEPEPTAEPTDEPEPTAESAPSAFAVSGQVWHDLCAVAGGEGGEEAVPSDGCITRDDGGFVANGTLESDEPGLIGIVVQLKADACPGGEVIAEATTDENGNYSFADVDAGSYCVAVDALADPNSTILIPGEWTTPTTGETTIDVADDVAVMPFGWDYQFLPVPGSEVVDDCIDSVAFAADVTIPDDTPFEPGTEFVKTWRLINTGGCTWGPDYAVQFVSGEQMGAPDEVPINQTVLSGQMVEISIPMVAPADPGTYRGDWQVRNPDGALLAIEGDAGAAFWLQIAVVEQGTFGSISGLVWDDLCDSDAYTFGISGTIPFGCVENLNGTVRGDGIFDEDNESGLSNVVVTIGSGVCGETVDITTVTTDSDGRYTFVSLLPDTYCVYVDVVLEGNLDMLPGNFTFPAPGRAGNTVELGNDEDVTDVNFGWDFSEEEPVEEGSGGIFLR